MGEHASTAGIESKRLLTPTGVKFAISMPRETLKRVDRAAKRLGMTRSHYIAVVLEGVARNERDAVSVAPVATRAPSGEPPAGRCPLGQPA
jgi:hypothetical protein